MKRSKPSPNSIALAGEFAVLSQLALGGYDANLTLGHTKNVDILDVRPRLGAYVQTRGQDRRATAEPAGEPESWSDDCSATTMSGY